jgi:UDP-N-acetylglucosamine acyltransferase
MSLIHATALVDQSAALHETVEVGPFAIVGPGVVLGEACRLHAHAQVTGGAILGERNEVFSHAVIGNPPQDKKYRGEKTRLEIGSGNTFRESVTINLGTVQDGGVTRIGHGNWIMAYVHIAHDCQIGSNTIMANAAQLGGHVHVDDWAIVGGITAVHQFVRIGAHAMTGAGTTLTQDLPPYVMANGNPASPHGINIEGLRRRGFSDDVLRLLRRAYKTLYKSGMGLAQAIEVIRSESTELNGTDAAALEALIRFLEVQGRGIVR